MTEVVLLVGLLCLAYLAWAQQQQLAVVEQDMVDVRFQIRELTTGKQAARSASSPPASRPPRRGSRRDGSGTETSTTKAATP